VRDDRVWPAIADALIRGAYHELNNRVASLSAVEQVISSGGEATAELREVLVSELKRMRGATDLLGRVPSSAPAAAYAVRPQDVLASAVELVRLHQDARDLEIEIACADDAPPVRVDPAAVARALLVMISAGVRSRSASPEPPLRFTCRSDGEMLEVMAFPLDLTEAEMDAVASWLRPFDGRIARTETRAFALSLPALVAGRG
jgi:hypothetical protein